MPRDQSSCIAVSAGIILCIDDSVSRYGKMYRVAALRGIVLIITDNVNYIETVLENKPVAGIPLIGVCLDYDIPGVKTKEITHELLCHLTVPVAVVSNNHSGCKELSAILDGYEVKNHIMPAGCFDWEERVLNWLTGQED
jgi:hypothetical protein